MFLSTAELSRVDTPTLGRIPAAHRHRCDVRLRRLRAALEEAEGQHAFHAYAAAMVSTYGPYAEYDEAEAGQLRREIADLEQICSEVLADALTGSERAALKRTSPRGSPPAGRLPRRNGWSSATSTGSIPSGGCSSQRPGKMALPNLPLRFRTIASGRWNRSRSPKGSPRSRRG